MTRLARLPLFPLLALPAGVVLLQWHGGQFWADKTGSTVWGWGASALLEWLALWAWHADARAEARAEAAGAGWSAFPELAIRKVAAALVTALLIAGPLYQVGSPLLREARETIALANRVDRTDAVLDTLRRASDQGRKVGRELAQLTIEANEAEAQAYGADAMGGHGRKALPGMERLLIGAQLVALVMFSVGVVAGIRSLATGGFQAKEVDDGNQNADRIYRMDGRVARRETGSDIRKLDERPTVETRLETDRPEPFRDTVPDLEALGLAKETASGGAPGPSPASGNGNGTVDIAIRREIAAITGAASPDYLTARAAEVARVRELLAERFPGMAPGEIAAHHAPPLKVELTRLKNWERDLERYRQGDPNVKLIGPAELGKLERLAQLGKMGAPRPS